MRKSFYFFWRMRQTFPTQNVLATGFEPVNPKDLCVKQGALAACINEHNNIIEEAYKQYHMLPCF